MVIMQPQRIGSCSLNELIINQCENGHSLLFLNNSRIGKKLFSDLKATVYRWRVSLDQVLQSHRPSYVCADRKKKSMSLAHFSHISALF